MNFCYSFRSVFVNVWLLWTKKWTDLLSPSVRIYSNWWDTDCLLSGFVHSSVNNILSTLKVHYLRQAICHLDIDEYLQKVLLFTLCNKSVDAKFVPIAAAGCDVFEDVKFGISIRRRKWISLHLSTTFRWTQYQYNLQSTSLKIVLVKFNLLWCHISK